MKAVTDGLIIAMKLEGKFYQTRIKAIIYFVITKKKKKESVDQIVSSWSIVSAIEYKKCMINKTLHSLRSMQILKNIGLGKLYKHQPVPITGAKGANII